MCMMEARNGARDHAPRAPNITVTVHVTVTRNRINCDSSIILVLGDSPSASFVAHTREAVLCLQQLYCSSSITCVRNTKCHMDKYAGARVGAGSKLGFNPRGMQVWGVLPATTLLLVLRLRNAAAMIACMHSSMAVHASVRCGVEKKPARRKIVQASRPQPLRSLLLFLSDVCLYVDKGKT